MEEWMGGRLEGWKIGRMINSGAVRRRPCILPIFQSSTHPVCSVESVVDYPACTLQTFDIELLHLQHGLKGSLGFCGVRIIKQLSQDLGHNLPGEAKLILQPAALLRLRIAALGQPLPVVVYLLLRRALDLERDGLVELENLAAVERSE
jgi:hypothetical protein